MVTTLPPWGPARTHTHTPPPPIGAPATPKLTTRQTPHTHNTVRVCVCLSFSLVRHRTGCDYFNRCLFASVSCFFFFYSSFFSFSSVLPTLSSYSGKKKRKKKGRTAGWAQKKKEEKKKKFGWSQTWLWVFVFVLVSSRMQREKYMTHPTIPPSHALYLCTLCCATTCSRRTLALMCQGSLVVTFRYSVLLLLLFLPLSELPPPTLNPHCISSSIWGKPLFDRVCREKELGPNCIRRCPYYVVVHML
jgi:hypothetical protein